MSTSPSQPILLTSVVGSYPQPDWLVDKDVLRGQYVPRVRTEKLWKMPRDTRESAIRDATLLAIRDMEAAGLDVITDGETARESYSNHFVMGLEGIDVDNPAAITSRSGHQVRVPRITAPVRHRGTVEVDAARFLREHTTRRAKITLPGPFTLAQQVHDEYYHDRRALALDFAAAVNSEALALEATGIDVIQLDEPWLRNDPDGARSFAVEALDRALRGVKVRKALHMCFGYAFLSPGRSKPSSYEYLEELAASGLDEISIEAAQPHLDLSVLRELKGKTIALGVLDHSTSAAEPAEAVAERIRTALKILPPERLMPSPDCGMKYMSRESALARLKALVDGTALVRRELS